MVNFLIKLFGFLPLIFFGDSAVFDRFLWLRKHLQKGALRTLDAGCGSGAFTIYAAKKGNEALGISFDSRNNEVASKRAKILKLDNVKFITADLRKLNELSDKLGFFDQIICFETIEHIFNDKALLLNFSRLLKENSRLLLTAPYKYHKGYEREKLAETENGDHVRWGYTHEELEELLSDTGFRVEKKDYITGYFSQKLIFTERILTKVIPSKIAWLIIFPFRLFRFFDSLLMKFIDYPYLSVGAVAVKK